MDKIFTIAVSAGIALMACTSPSLSSSGQGARQGNSVRGSVPAAPTTVTRPVAWTITHGLCEPETALYDPARDEIYVSNICGFKRNGKGYLSRIGRDGRMIETQWVAGMNAPAGMTLRGGRLFVADVDVVREIDIARGHIVRSIALDTAPRALNDITMDRAGMIYVSDSAKHRVYRLHSKGEARAEQFPLGTEFRHANGLHAAGGTLYVGGQSLWQVSLQTGSVATFGPAALADIDGIEDDGQGGLVASVVGGPIWHLASSGAATVYAAAGVSSTNHLYLPEQRLVVVPTGYDNTIVAFTLPEPREDGIGSR